MYGKHFESLYDGSMFGRPALVFAVWSYAITKQKPAKDGMCYVELNPVLLAATFAESVENVLEVIRELESPDLRSRSQEMDGRRLVRADSDDTGPPLGPTLFRVVNGPKYRAIRDEDERREYLREAKRRERAKKSTASTVKPVREKGSKSAAGQQRQQLSTMSTQAEAEAEAEAEAGESTSRASAREEESKPAATENKKAEPQNPAGTLELPEDGIAAVEIIQRTVAILAPDMNVPDDFTVSLWLRDRHPHPWCIAAELCAASHRMAGKSTRFLSAIVSSCSKWTCELPDEDGKPINAQDYVSYILNPVRLARMEEIRMFRDFAERVKAEEDR